jgi:HEAT repeat protein
MQPATVTILALVMNGAVLTTVLAQPAAPPAPSAAPAVRMPPATPPAPAIAVQPPPTLPALPPLPPDPVEPFDELEPFALLGPVLPPLPDAAAALDEFEAFALLDPVLSPLPPIELESFDMALADHEAQAVIAQPAAPPQKAVREKARREARDVQKVTHVKAGKCREGEIGSAEDAHRMYECGRRALDRAEWDVALQNFTKVAAAKQGSRVAGAVYWRAYAQNKLGQRAEALATLGELKTAWPSSGWANEASALEVEIRQSSGQPVPPDAAADDDLKLLALQGLANRDAELAVPMIERLLRGAQPPRLKNRALFVLAHSPGPAAREVVLRVARGAVNPDLQVKAVEYLGMLRTPETTRALSEIYASTEDTTVKRAALRGFAAAGDRERLLAAAKQEAAPELRLEAVRQLGGLNAGDALAEIYGRETSAEVKKQILRGLAASAQQDKLATVVRTETDPELKRTGIRSLGLKPDPATADFLVSLYPKDPNPDVRRAIIDALHAQQNAPALVSLARQEKDAELRKAIVSRLSTMKAKEATDYLVELLK